VDFPSGIFKNGISHPLHNQAPPTLSRLSIRFKHKHAQQKQASRGSPAFPNVIPTNNTNEDMINIIFNQQAFQQVQQDLLPCG